MLYSAEAWPIVNSAQSASAHTFNIFCDLIEFEMSFLYDFFCPLKMYSLEKT